MTATVFCCPIGPVLSEWNTTKKSKHHVMVFCGNLAAWTERAWFCFSYGFPVADKVVESLMLGTGLGHLRWGLCPQGQREHGEKKGAECGCAFHRCPPERDE